MLLMLDSNICIYAMNHEPGADRIWRRVSGRSYGEIMVSAITLAELRFGAEKGAARRVAGNLDKLQRFMEMFQVEDYPAAAAPEFAQVRLACLAAGLNPGRYDMLIASHALHLGATLITNDGDFSGIAGLKTENWLAG